MLALGEVHTGLLQNSASLSKMDAARLLDLVAGERVRESERPIDYAASPERLFGVDCRLATASRAYVRGVGTAATRTTMTGGHVVQGSTYCLVRPSAGSHRLAWSHYLGRPGTVETIGKAAADDLARGFVGPAGREAERVLDLGAICGRSIDDVQRSPVLDRRTPLKTSRTRLRWAVTGTGADDDVDIRFTVESPTLRTLRITMAGPAVHPAANPAGDPTVGPVVALCEDLALHDWLLTTLVAMIDRNLTYGSVGERSMQRLRPAIDHLLHLWMPAARIDASLLPVWESMERRPGFTRQWRACVSRIRDQVTMNAIALIGGGGGQRGATT